MTAPDLHGVRSAVVGAGKSGLAAAALLRSRGAEVLLLDEKPVEVGAPAGVELRVGRPGFDLRGRELVVVSPGVPWNHPDLASARSAGIRTVAEVELASWFLSAPIAAVTGTNGKSTTTGLLGSMLSAAGRRTFVGGNLGTPLSEAVGGSYDALAVELSSFQLEGIDTLHPRAATILNLTSDHVDRHPTLEAYADAKARIFRNQEPGDLSVLNADDPWFARFRSQARGQLKTFGIQAAADARPAPAGFAVGQRSYRVVNPALRGEHNLANAMAAALLASGMDVAPEAIQAGLDGFPGLPHRLELVRQLRDVEWIDDSKATNVDSTAVALKAIPGSLIWIAGGRGKGVPYKPLEPLLGGRLRRSLLIGEDAGRIERDLPEHAEQLQTLERAVARAAEIARPGDTVLMSPACASYDQFKNYEERGQRFRALVEAL
jgi:UDP-N-acetylmuramoylalanine--D-glutamate ligase